MNRSALQAINYYSEGYYDESQTRWYGLGAAALGLSGRVNNKESFANVCNGFTPDGTKQIGMNTERAAIDCNFAAPKSVSLTALVGGDERLEVAHRLAVEKTLSYMEEHFAQTRVQVNNGKRIKEKTGNLIAAQFDHIESRELDPHMHTHALVMNLTQRDNSDWYSLANEGIKFNQKHLGMIYQSYLANEVQRLGYETEARPHGQFEIKGYKAKDLETFSKRRQQIISVVGADASWQSRENAWSITRKNKQHVPHDELKAKWREEAAALGIEIVKPGEPRETVSDSIKMEHLDDAIAHCSERNVEFSRQDLEKFIFSLNIYPDIRELQPLIDNHADLKSLGDTFTTMAALQREDDTITCMARGRGKVNAIATTDLVNDALNQSTLNSGQRQAVRLASTTTDRVVAWQGVAGSGKTFALQQFKAIAEASGYEIQGFAPSSQAAKVLSTELGIEANTVARKLVTESPEELPTHQIWIVDEAGLLGANDALDLLRRAEQENARILLVGDTKQLSSVAAGNPFKSLQQAGIKTALMNESLRQRTPELKIAVDLLSDGMIEKGFRKLEENGSIIELAKEDVAAHIANEYMLIPKEKRDKTLVLSGNNAQRQEITAAIREQLASEGTIGTDTAATQLVARNDLTSVQMQYAHHFDIGDVAVPIRDYKRRGLIKGEHYSVVGKKGKDLLILKGTDGKQFESDAKFDKALYKPQLTGIAVGDRLKWTKNDHKLERRNGQEFTIETIEWDKASIKYEDSKTEVIDLGRAQHLDHAIVNTTYSSQGKTADNVLWAAATDATASMENFYVAASRAKYDLKIYTDNKGKLLEKAKESKTNKIARDLVLRQEVFAREHSKLEASVTTGRSETQTRKPTPMPSDIVHIDPTVVKSSPGREPVPSPVKKNQRRSVEKKPAPTPAPAPIKRNDTPVVNEEIVSAPDTPIVARDEVSLQTSPPTIITKPAVPEPLSQQPSIVAEDIQNNIENRPTSRTQSDFRDIELQAHIRSFLQLNDRDLMMMNRFIKDYFRTPESKTDTQNTQDKRALLEALESPEVRERVDTISTELNRIREQERMMEQSLQQRMGRGR
ncbi:MAG: relaxase domain-containing protein [Nostocaceae cyanobacterium]|nr:relaxase domain-containing protein [Nostocaceae cyanobacterium]